MEGTSTNKTTSIIIGLGVVAVLAFLYMRSKANSTPSDELPPEEEPELPKLVLTPRNSPTISADSTSVTGTPTIYWSQGAIAKLGYTTSGVLKAKTSLDSITGIIGLDRMPSATSSMLWNNTDYFWYFYDDTTDGSRRAMACKTDAVGQTTEAVLFSMPTFSKSDTFEIKFDATNVTYFVNGVQKATTPRISQDPLYMVVSLGKGTNVGFTDISYTGTGVSNMA